jgi:hypothetical protein
VVKQRMYIYIIYILLHTGMWVRGPCSSSTRLAKGLPVLSRAADHNGLGRLGRRPSRSVEMPAAPPGRATKVTAVVKREVCFVCFGDVKRNRKKKRKQSLYYLPDCLCGSEPF